jgi:Ca2+/Na+ antiporter
MRYFILLDFQHWVLALFLGLLAVLFVYIAWSGYPSREAEEPIHEELASGHGSSSHPIPPLLVFVFVGAILWLLAYVVMRGIYGGAIS